MQGVVLPFSDQPRLRRRPSIQVVANGLPLSGIVSASIHANNYYSADSFDLTLSLTADPQVGAAFWSSQTAIDLDVRFRTDANAAFGSVIQGRADQVRLDPIAGVVQVEGRDYAASLIDSAVCETFTNRTASEIAILLAQRHGLLPVVSPTSSIVGRYYQNEHDTISLDHFCGRASEWDLLAYLAQEESSDLFVAGRTLNFVPEKPNVDIDWVCTPNDVIELRLHRRLTLAGNIEVIVKTWNSRQHQTETQTASLTRIGGNSTASNNAEVSSRYVLIRPNLTSDAALQLAKRKLVELCKHDRTIDLLMPGSLGLSPRSVIMLQGTDSDFDQAYRVTTIDWTFSPSAGFVQRVRGSSVQSPPLFV